MLIISLKIKVNVWPAEAAAGALTPPLIYLLTEVPVALEMKV